MYQGYTPTADKQMTTRQKLNTAHAEITAKIAEAYAEGHDEFAFALLEAANKVAEAEKILQDLAAEYQPPIQFTDDNPAALKCNGVRTP